MNTPLSRSRQRGVAALLMTTLLCLATLLVVAYANRHIVVEERVSATQYRAAQAFEAAEAGIDWAVARLNDPSRVDASCRPSGDVSAASLRDRWLRFQGAAGQVVPTTWNDAGTPMPLRAACVRTGAGWACSCPTDAAPAPALPAGNATAPAFSIELSAAPQAGIVRIVSLGCTRRDADCNATLNVPHEATSRVEAAFALLPALRSAPVAALTVRGDVTIGAAALGAHQRDAASGGLALHAGGNVVASALRLTAPAGSPLAESLVAGDAALAGLDRERFFARWFGMSVAAWSAQPAVTTVACTGDCTGALRAAVDAGSRLVFVDGDATLTGPAVFGTPEDPVVVTARGAISLSGAVTVHGVVHGAGLRWDDATAPAALVRGATLVAGHYTGNGASDLVHDTAILDRLKSRAGSFVRVNGSWKDF